MSSNEIMGFMPNTMTPPGEQTDLSEGEQELTPEQSEAQMRRALEGLSAHAPRGPGAPAQPFGRPANNRPQNDRFQGKNGSGHSPGYPAAAARKHRFVQDGEVQVVHLPPQKDRPRDAAPVAVADQRLNRESTARDNAAREPAQHERSDRALLDAQAAVRGLQTKLAHAEIALSEAVQRAHVQAEAAGAARAELQQARADARAAEHARDMLQARLADQREKMEAEIAQLRAELDVARLPSFPPAALVHEALVFEAPVIETPADVLAWPVQTELLPSPPRLPMKRGRKPREKPPEIVEVEPEPVKWWLSTKPKPERAARGSKKKA